MDGRYQIKSDPPNIVPLKELTSGRPAEEIREMVGTMLRRYRESLPDSRSALLNRYQLGEDDAFEKAIAGYAAAYANLAEADYAAFRSTSSGRTAALK